MADNSTESVSCSLADDDAARQLLEWRSLADEALAVEPLADGVRLRLPVDLAEVAADLVAREARCCSFLELAVTVDQGESGPETVVDVRSVSPDGLAVVSALTGVSLR